MNMIRAFAALLRVLHPRRRNIELTDATTWEVQLNGIAVGNIPEHVVAEIERRLNRQWWLGMRTAIGQLCTFIRLAVVSITVGLAIESILILLAIEGDPRGAGHAIHSVLSASEATLQSGWNTFCQLGVICVAVYFVVALAVGRRRRAHDFVAEAWWINVRRAAPRASQQTAIYLSC